MIHVDAEPKELFLQEIAEAEKKVKAIGIPVALIPLALRVVEFFAPDDMCRMTQYELLAGWRTVSPAGSTEICRALIELGFFTKSEFLPENRNLRVINAKIGVLVRAFKGNTLFFNGIEFSTVDFDQLPD